MALLEVNQLTKNFGGLAAVSNVSLKLEEQELVGLIGPNGAGKGLSPYQPLMGSRP